MKPGRAIVIGIGSALIVFGLVLQFRPDLAEAMLGPLLQPGAGPILLGAALVLSGLFEGRYKRLRSRDAPRGIERDSAAGWESTAETFRDEESGQWVRVWFHRESGQRRYEPIDRPG